MQHRLTRANRILCGSFSAALSLFAAAALPPNPAEAAVPAGYSGTPYKDSVMEIHGLIQLYRFDEGPEEMTWHDFESRNVWYCKLREPAAVGLQLMGAGGDKWEPGKAEPGMSLVKDDCYMAQTNQGDWTKYTVRVKQKGTYSLSFLEAANGTNIPFVGVSFLDGADSVGTGSITLPLTSYFHNWVYARDLATIELDTGLQVMRFDIVGNGPMNVNFVDFTLAGPSSVDGPGGRSGGAGLPAIARAERDGRGRLRLSLDRAGQGNLEVSVHDLAGRLLFSGRAEAVAGDGREYAVGLPPGTGDGLVFLRLSRDGVQGRAKAYPVGR